MNFGISETVCWNWPISKKVAGGGGGGAGGETRYNSCGSLCWLNSDAILRLTSSLSAKEKNICRLLAEYILDSAKYVTKIKQKFNC